MSHNNLIPFRCSDRLKSQLTQVAQTQEVTLSEVIRLACEHYVSQTPLESNVIPFVGTITGGKDDQTIWEAIKAAFTSSVDLEAEVSEVAA